jgi:hypothetical protein
MGEKSTAPSISSENTALANSAITTALAQLEQTSNKFVKLNMYFIASRLCQKTGNEEDMRKCDTLCQDAIRSSEQNSQIDEEQMRAAASILDSMAYAFISVDIPDRVDDATYWGRQPAVKPFTEKDFKDSEDLRLKAVAILDRLDANNHLRRKAHRDLTLWYMRLGKKEKEDQQKQILFELVGCKDDSMLYPQVGGCGTLVWWKQERVQFSFECGMG